MGEDQYKLIFSKNLKHYMSINNKEQIDLINDLGFNRSAVSTWVNGTRLPRMDKVDALARYFQISRSDLIEDRSIDTKVSSKTLKYTDMLLEQVKKLNERGKKKLLDNALELTCNPLYNDDYMTAVAAHERTDVNVTDEMKKHDDDIMNDDSKWE